MGMAAHDDTPPGDEGREEPEAPRVAAKVKRPADPETVRGWLQKKAAKLAVQYGPRPPSQAQIGLLASKLAEALGGGEEGEKARHSVLFFVFGKESTKELSGAEASAVLNWLLEGKDEDTGDYIINELAAKEARLILRQCLKDAGQLDMFEEGEGGTEEDLALRQYQDDASFGALIANGPLRSPKAFLSYLGAEGTFEEWCKAHKDPKRRREALNLAIAAWAQTVKVKE